VVEVADLFCRQAGHRAVDLFDALWSNDDTANHSLAQDVLEGRHLWLEEGVMDPSDIAPAPQRPGPAGQTPDRGDAPPPRAATKPGVGSRAATGTEERGS
jgi:hypothetical protein